MAEAVVALEEAVGEEAVEVAEVVEVAGQASHGHGGGFHRGIASNFK